MKYFGTDGIRDRAGEGMLSDDNVRRVGIALGRALQAGAGARSAGAPVLIGRDTRGTGPQITSALAAGLRAAGVEALDLGVISTPGVAFITRAEQAACGVVISASHNPADDNGIKIFGADGYKASDELEQAVEAGIDALVASNEQLPTNGGAAPREATHLLAAWEDDLVARGGGDGALAGLTCVLDCANGAASAIAPRVFGRLGATVHTHFAEPDGRNINAGCGALSPQVVAPFVREHGAQIGFTFDGDADRMIAIDEHGDVRDGDFTLAILGRRLHARGELPGETVVTTVMANIGLEISLREAGIHLERTAVGDKYVAARMREAGFVLGGEQSGHILWFGSDNGHEPVTTGDGILSAVLMARTLRESGETLSALSSCLTRLPQLLVNVRVTDKPELLSIDPVRKATEAAEKALGADGRIVLRYSGTEALARVMVEGRSMAEITALANAIADAIRREIGAEG
ncbi:MAG: phosphoglucosamine mutase [Planctomycetota bacterium]